MARLGGDEFGVLMRGIESEALERPLERLAARNDSPDSVFRIQYSAGIVTDTMSSPPSMAELLAEADQYMYEQKLKRRDGECAP